MDPRRVAERTGGRIGRLLYRALPAIGPLAGAVAVVWGGPWLLAFARLRPGAVPVALFALLVGLLLPSIREGLVTALCFMVALLAWQDARIPAGDALPQELDYTLTEQLYPYVWGGIALWAFATGFLVAFRPQSLAARRSYFASAGAYFTGHGSLSVLRAVTLDGILMLSAGLAAFVATFSVHRLWSASTSQPDLLGADTLPEQERARRAARVAAREWQDYPEHDTKPC